MKSKAASIKLASHTFFFGFMRCLVYLKAMILAFYQINVI